MVQTFAGMRPPRLLTHQHTGLSASDTLVSTHMYNLFHHLHGRLTLMMLMCYLVVFYVRPVSMAEADTET